MGLAGRLYIPRRSRPQSRLWPVFGPNLWAVLGPVFARPQPRLRLVLSPSLVLSGHVFAPVSVPFSDNRLCPVFAPSLSPSLITVCDPFSSRLWPSLCPRLSPVFVPSLASARSRLWPQLGPHHPSAIDRRTRGRLMDLPRHRHSACTGVASAAGTLLLHEHAIIGGPCLRGTGEGLPR